MVGFCGCFSPSQVRYQESASSGEAPRRAALLPSSVPSGAQQVPAGAALPAYKPAVKPPSSLRASAPALGSFLHHSSQHNQLLNPSVKAAPSAAAAPAGAEDSTPIGGPKLSSHRIAISPIECSTATPDSLSAAAAADTVRQDNPDTPKGNTAAAGISSFNELLAKQGAAADGSSVPPTADLAAGAADVPARHSKSADAQASQKKHTSSSGAAKVFKAEMRTPPSNRKSSAGGAMTPPAHHTPRSGMGVACTPSPSVARPTCASMSRAQAVAASMPTASGAGHWKL